MSQIPKLPDDLPKTKFDSEAVDALRALSFQEIEPYLPNIIAWVQDLNWPIAESAIKFVNSFEVQAIPAIKTSLIQSRVVGDAIWAQNIIELFIKPFKREIIALYIEELTAWCYHDNFELKILIFEILAKNRIGDQDLLKKWVTTNRKVCEEYAVALSLIEKEFE